jgi:hypothetical protein
MKIKTGDKVTYVATDGRLENGIVKKIHPDGDKAYVVYNCNGEWYRYEDYAGALTEFDDMVPGWRAKMKNGMNIH